MLTRIALSRRSRSLPLDLASRCLCPRFEDLNLSLLATETTLPGTDVSVILLVAAREANVHRSSSPRNPACMAYSFNPPMMSVHPSSPHAAPSPALILTPSLTRSLPCKRDSLTHLTISSRALLGEDAQQRPMRERLRDRDGRDVSTSRNTRPRSAGNLCSGDGRRRPCACAYLPRSADLRRLPYESCCARGASAPGSASHGEARA